MSYEVKLHREVAKTLAGMSPKTRSRIIRALRMQVSSSMFERLVF